MSTEGEAATCSAADEAERLEILESQMRELVDKTRTQESGSLENKRRLEELAREAEKHKTEIMGMLANFVGSNTAEEAKEISSEGARDEPPPEVSSERKNEEIAGDSS